MSNLANLKADKLLTTSLTFLNLATELAPVQDSEKRTSLGNTGPVAGDTTGITPTETLEPHNLEHTCILGELIQAPGLAHLDPCRGHPHTVLPPVLESHFHEDASSRM